MIISPVLSASISAWVVRSYKSSHDSSDSAVSSAESKSVNRSHQLNVHVALLLIQSVTIKNSSGDNTQRCHSPVAASNHSLVLSIYSVSTSVVVIQIDYVSNFLCYVIASHYFPYSWQSWCNFNWSVILNKHFGFISATYHISMSYLCYEHDVCLYVFLSVTLVDCVNTVPRKKMEIGTLDWYLHAKPDPDQNILWSIVWKMYFALQWFATAPISRYISICWASFICSYLHVCFQL